MRATTHTNILIHDDDGLMPGTMSACGLVESAARTSIVLEIRNNTHHSLFETCNNTSVQQLGFEITLVPSL
jgi:hypothetical protein